MDNNGADNQVFRMLILSDLHYESTRKEDFEHIFEPFLQTLSTFLKSHPEWAPQCLTLAGDIVHCKEDEAESYSDIRTFIERIKQEIGTSFHVVAVPGNHDKQLTKIEEGINDAKLASSQKDLADAEAFLEVYTDTTPEACKKVSRHLKQYYGHYAQFISPYYKEENWHPVPNTDIDKELRSISGYYLLKQSKICLVALNTEWKYVISNAGQYRSILTLDEKTIKQMEKRILSLKRNGYTIITLMHRSPYRLCWKDIYGSVDENSLVERIIGMSDLIICGHEHNAKNREPDMLMNKTLLYQNGSMFDRSKEDGRYPYSASLVRIDKKARILHVLNIRFNTQNALTYEWTASVNEAKRYSMEPLLSATPRQKIFNNELYKEVSLFAPTDPELLKKKIRSLFYPGSEPKDIPNYINCDIFPLNASTIEQVHEKIEDIKQKPTTGEPLSRLYVLLLYSERFEGKYFETQTQDAITSYKVIKSLIKSEKIEHKLVTNLVFCNILF